MNVTDAQIAALQEAAPDGISLDGLHVTTNEETDTYTFATPNESHSSLTKEFGEVAEDNTEYVTNWYYWTQSDLTEEGQAYLRWLEHADNNVLERYDALCDGIERTWGELCITTTINETGERRYTLHNETDRGRDDLDEYDDPLDARQIAKYDDDGRYRPLKTAPTLRTGWQFTDLSGNGLLRTVDFFYPATVQNWYLERHDALDVSHWRATAERQTGIYDIIDELDPEAVEWLAQACCVDSQCLKRRQWDENGSEKRELDVPRGEGEFPCREPCSLVIAAARKWTLLEREQPTEYTFSLTPSEKEQIEEIIECVASGNVDDIREADMGNGANRYRARYLKAKQFDENGRLDGVPTDSDENR